MGASAQLAEFRRRAQVNSRQGAEQRKEFLADRLRDERPVGSR